MWVPCGYHVGTMWVQAGCIARHSTPHEVVAAVGSGRGRGPEGRLARYHLMQQHADGPQVGLQRVDIDSVEIEMTPRSPCRGRE